MERSLCFYAEGKKNYENQLFGRGDVLEVEWNWY